MNDPGVDGTAVFNAAKTYLTGFDDSSFGNLMRDWHITNIVSDIDVTGYYSYNGEIAQLTKHVYTGGSASLLPGESIYRNIGDGTVFLNSSPIFAAGISTAEVPDFTSPYPAGVLVVYNSGMSESVGTSGTGVLPSQTDTASISFKSLSLLPAEKIDYPIGVVIKIKDFSPLKNKRGAAE